RVAPGDPALLVADAADTARQELLEPRQHRVDQAVIPERGVVAAGDLDVEPLDSARRALERGQAVLRGRRDRVAARADDEERDLDPRRPVEELAQERARRE